MEKVSRVILLLLLLLVGNRQITEAFAGSSGETQCVNSDVHPCHTVDQTENDLVSSFGEYGQNMILESIPVSQAPSGNPISSPSPLKNFPNKSNYRATYLALPEGQYDVNTPFYCLSPGDYYIFALRRIII